MLGKDALAGDPVSAFGGVLICNSNIDLATAEEINKIFCEIVVSPSYDNDALEVLKKQEKSHYLSAKEREVSRQTISHHFKWRFGTR